MDNKNIFRKNLLPKNNDIKMRVKYSKYVPQNTNNYTMFYVQVIHDFVLVIHKIIVI